jgi:hypothetical protein
MEKLYGVSRQIRVMLATFNPPHSQVTIAWSHMARVLSSNSVPYRYNGHEFIGRWGQLEKGQYVLAVFR